MSNNTTLFDNNISFATIIRVHYLIIKKKQANIIRGLLRYGVIENTRKLSEHGVAFVDSTSRATMESGSQQKHVCPLHKKYSNPFFVVCFTSCLNKLLCVLYFETRYHHRTLKCLTWSHSFVCFQKVAWFPLCVTCLQYCHLIGRRIPALDTRGDAQRDFQSFT